jgi:hypothetical protein
LLASRPHFAFPAGTKPQEMAITASLQPSAAAHMN